MPRRSTRVSTINILSKIRNNLFRWRSVVFAFYVLSILLIAETIHSLIYTSNYPTSKLEDIVSFRSIESNSSVFSSVEFTEAPVNTKQMIDIDLVSLSKVDIEWICEIYLTEDVTLHYDDFRFFSFEKVTNLEVFFNGRIMECYCLEYEGTKYYAISGYNVTGKNKISRLEIHFQIERTVTASKLTRIPWLFNENYAKIIHLPITNAPVHTGNTSDLSALNVDLGLPFHRILKEHSGWVDLFVPPKCEWERYRKESNLYEFPRFEYPITQDCKEQGTTYSFEVRFSENNIASRLSLVIVPSYGIPAMLCIFLSSAFYISLYVLIPENKSMSKSKIVKPLLSILKIYSGPLLGLLVMTLTFFGGEFNLSLFSYTMEVTNPIALFFVAIYPILFFVSFRMWMKERSA